jgi:hypothetical protein
MQMSKNIRAYPSGESYTTFNNASGVTSHHSKSPLHHGMTLRDHFAGLAMQGLLAADKDTLWNEDDIAFLAYGQADAMLERREKNG